MPSNVARYSFVLILIHWVLVLMSFVLLGLGWYIEYVPQEPPARSVLLDLHMSLGLTGAILLSIQIVLWIVFKPSSFPNEFPKWRKVLVYTLYLLIYVSFTLMLISGYVQADFSAAPIRFWGTPLPGWGTADIELVGFFETVHGVAAFVLAGSIFVHLCIGALNIFKHPGIAARTPPPGTQEFAGACPGRIKIPNRIQDRANVSEKATPLRLVGILVTVRACLRFRAIIGTWYLRACIQPRPGRVWRCHLLGWLRIFAFVFCGHVGLLLHASRQNSRRKTGFLF